MDHSIKNLSAADIVTLGFLFRTYDADGDGKMNLEEFTTLASDLTRRNFTFNGPVNLDTITTSQLAVLLWYEWKRRRFQELQEGQEPDNAAVAIDEKRDMFDAETTESKNNVTSDSKTRVVPQLTVKQKAQVQQICEFVKSTCAELFAEDSDLQLRAQNLGDQSESDEVPLKEIIALVLNFMAKVQSQVQAGNG